MVMRFVNGRYVVIFLLAQPLFPYATNMKKLFTAWTPLRREVMASGSRVTKLVLGTQLQDLTLYVSAGQFFRIRAPITIRQSSAGVVWGGGLQNKGKLIDSNGIA